MTAPNLSLSCGELARQRPHAAAVLARHGVDVCCEGPRSLEEICYAHGVSPERLLGELDEDEPAHAEDAPLWWRELETPELIDAVVRHYHRIIPDSLGPLAAMAETIDRNHGGEHPLVSEAARTVIGLATSLPQQLAQEEHVLFPWLRQEGEEAADAARTMLAEHARLRRTLNALRARTANYRRPSPSCPSWQALWQGLRTMDGRIRDMLRVEDDVLLPRMVPFLR